MIADSDLNTLRIAVDGPVLTEGDADFTAYAGGYNAAVVRRPDVIIGATSVTDVIAAIGWAAKRRLPVAVQATGHGVTERMVDGVLINTRRMQDIQVDPDRGCSGRRRRQVEGPPRPDSSSRPRRTLRLEL